MASPIAAAGNVSAGHATPRAVTYLRVSTKEQAEKGGQDEGYSIPAQRAANHRKAEQLGAEIIEEFTDAGESARKADRPALQRMLAYVAEHRVSYCIVHKVDRLARNRADDVTIHLALQQAGVMLVSASENIDETPSGMLLHGIMSSIAEFYSRNLSTEAVKGMTQKALTGGTPNRAPIGYLNVGVRDAQGREVRTVRVDPDRAPLITWAFKAFASGDWTITQMREELNRRGLTTVPTPKRPAGPLSKNAVNRILTNPYYKGTVVFRGTSYKGAHEPIVPAEVFSQVQLVLESHNSAVDRTQLHDHYLKGTVYCGLCRSRLIIVNAKNPKGVIYPYFVCSGRHNKATDCDFQAVPIAKVEHLVRDHYATITIPPETRLALRGALNSKFDELVASAKPELEGKTAEARQLEAEQDQLVRAHLAGNLAGDVMGRMQRELAAKLEIVRGEIANLAQDYAAQRQFIDDSLALADDPQALYDRSNADTRRMANQVFFKRLYITERAEGAPPRA
ncbi:MAG: recombinase family protein, partial [Bifidobacteriaceae bacterium]|nr:recombinase family protein [Bifidobacteriaceae bacterium]